MLDNIKSMEFVWQLCHIATGHMTHLVTGLVAQDPSFALSIKCCYNLLPCHETGIFTKYYDGITAGSCIWNKQFYFSRQCHHNIVLSTVCGPSGGAEINQHSESIVVPVHVLPNKLHYNSHFVLRSGTSVIT